MKPIKTFNSLVLLSLLKIIFTINEKDKSKQIFPAEIAAPHVTIQPQIAV